MQDYADYKVMTQEDRRKLFSLLQVLKRELDGGAKAPAQQVSAESAWCSRPPLSSVCACDPRVRFAGSGDKATAHPLLTVRTYRILTL